MGECRSKSFDESKSLGFLLDRVRPRVIEAREQGKKPSVVRVSPLLFEEVKRCKELEMERGVPPLVLGLRVVSDPDVTFDQPIVE